MNLTTLTQHIPPYASELISKINSMADKLNHSKNGDSNNAAVALAASYTSQSPDVIAAMIGEVATGLSIEDIDLARRASLLHHLISIGDEDLDEALFKVAEPKRRTFILSLLASSSMTPRALKQDVLIAYAQKFKISKQEIQLCLWFAAVLAATAQTLVIEQHIVFKPSEQAA